MESTHKTSEKKASFNSRLFSNAHNKPVLVSQSHGRLDNKSGSGMVEVLVSLLILAVGLLGVISLQINALSSIKRASFTSEAQRLAANMADHILSHGPSGKGARDGSFVTDTISNTIADSHNLVDCSVACNEGQQINHIHARWQHALQTRLPGGIGTVSWDSARLVYTITVRWEQEKSSVSNCGGSSTAGLACFVIQVKL